MRSSTVRKVLLFLVVLYSMFVTSIITVYLHNEILQFSAINSLIWGGAVVKTLGNKFKPLPYFKFLCAGPFSCGEIICRQSIVPNASWIAIKLNLVTPTICNYEDYENGAFKHFTAFWEFTLSLALMYVSVSIIPLLIISFIIQMFMINSKIRKMLRMIFCISFPTQKGLLASCVVEHMWFVISYEKFTQDSPPRYVIKSFLITNILMSLSLFVEAVVITPLISKYGFILDSEENPLLAKVDETTSLIKKSKHSVNIVDN